MNIPNGVLKNSLLLLHFDIKRLCQLKTNFPKQLKHKDFSKIEHILNIVANLEEIIIFCSSFKRCANFPHFPKYVDNFPKFILGSLYPVPKRDVTALQIDLQSKCTY